MSARHRAGPSAALSGEDRERRERGEVPQPRAAASLARAVFAVLVLACIGAFLLTQRLKHTPTAVQEFKLTPSFAPSASRSNVELEAISFKLEHADEVTVTIIDTSGDAVATLVRGYPVPRYKRFSLRWNGRRGIARRYARQHTETGHEILVALPEGRLAPPGEYRVEVKLRHQHKTLRSPRVFTLEKR